MTPAPPLNTPLAVDSVECRLDTDSAGLHRRLQDVSSTAYFYDLHPGVDAGRASTIV